MLSSRFLKNDKSKSFGIIRAVAIFFLVTVVVYFGTSLVIMMADFKLKDNNIRFKYGADRDWVFQIYDLQDLMTREEVRSIIENAEGTSDITVCRYGSFELEIDNDSLSDEYWDAYYKIASMFYKPGELTKEDFLKDEKNGDYHQRPVGVIAFEDEVFNKMAKEVNAVSAGEGEMPCIVVTNLSISTDQFMMGKARDFKYIEVNDPYKVQEGEDLLPVGTGCLFRFVVAVLIITYIF